MRRCSSIDTVGVSPTQRRRNSDASEFPRHSVGVSPTLSEFLRRVGVSPTVCRGNSDSVDARAPTDMGEGLLARGQTGGLELPASRVEANSSHTMWSCIGQRGKWFQKRLHFCWGGFDSSRHTSQRTPAAETQQRGCVFCCFSSSAAGRRFAATGRRADLQQPCADYMDLAHSRPCYG